MPQSVIDRLNVKAKGQPSHPVFTDRSGNVIGDIPFDVGRIETDAMNSDHTISDAMNSDYTNSDIELEQINLDHYNSDVDLPGVHIPEVGEYDEIPGVDTAQEQELPEPYVDAGVDFDNPAPQELPLVELEPHKSLSKPTMVFAGQHESASNQLTTSLP